MRMAGWIQRARVRVLDPRGWWTTSVLGILAAALRLPYLGRPHEFVFDETYYAKDAFSLLKHGYERAFIEQANALLLRGNTDVFKLVPEFVVHPPLGKWMIALGEATFGMNPFGWRIVMALLGVGAIMILHRSALRLSGDPLMAALAGLFMAIDGLAIAMSRTALLDQTLMFFVLATFHCLLRDRDHYSHTLVLREYLDDVTRWRDVRPWRLLAIVFITAALATKWSALWFALAFALLAFAWDARARREHGISAARTWWQDLLWLFLAALLGIAGYLLSWIGWFRSANAWDRTSPAGPPWIPQPVRALVHYHQQALDFHVNLTSSHPYKAAPYWWPLMLRPTSFSYNTIPQGRDGCRASSCSSEVLALGNIVIWWVACLTILALIVAAFTRLLRTQRGLHRRVAWNVVSAPLVGVAAGWLPWLYWHERTTFTFYSIVYTPFICILAAYGLVWFSTRDTIVVTEIDDEVTITVHYEGVHRIRRRLAVTLVVLAVAFSVFFYPIWTGMVIPYWLWQGHMWLSSWV